MSAHLKNKHKMTSAEIRKQNITRRAMKEDYNVQWQAPTSSCEDEGEINKDQILVDHMAVREELMNITAAHFRIINVSISQQYSDLHAKMVDVLRNLQAKRGFNDILDGDKHIHSVVEKILRPSHLCIEQASNVEMFRVANQLQYELTS